MDGFSDLRFFSLLIREGSLAAAAQQMGVTPPAVSRRLSLLERRLGVRLLQRTTRRIHLTPEGEAYLLDGARILADLEALERSISGTRATARVPAVHCLHAGLWPPAAGARAVGLCSRLSRGAGATATDGQARQPGRAGL